MRELRSDDADRGRGLGLVADALAFVHDPRQVALGVHLTVVKRKRNVLERQQLEQSRGLGRADLLLAVLDLLASEHQSAHQHLGRQSNLAIVVPINLDSGLIFGWLVFDFGRSNAGSEPFKGLVRHLVHHQGTDTHAVNPNFTHDRTPLSFVPYGTLLKCAPKDYLSVSYTVYHII